jgi:CubicO group peptidase (beta-lactamase class C family)
MVTRLRGGAVYLALLSLGAASSAFGDAVDDFLKSTIAEGRIPGIAVAIIRNGAVIKMGTAGLSNLETDTPVTTQTAFDLASLTKPFTATAIMLLEQDGKLHLEDPVTKFVPNLPSTWKDITLHHLMTHTSGLPELVPRGE